MLQLPTRQETFRYCKCVPQKIKTRNNRTKKLRQSEENYEWENASTNPCPIRWYPEAEERRKNMTNT